MVSPDEICRFISLRTSFLEAFPYLKNTFLNSYKKNKKVKQSCLSNGQLYEIKINNNSENLDEIKNKSKDEKIFTFKKKEKNIELESEKSTNNNNQDNTKITKSDNNLIKVDKKKNVSDDILSSDSSQENDSIEEDVMERKITYFDKV